MSRIILNGATVTGAGASVFAQQNGAYSQPKGAERSFQVWASDDSGSLGATVNIEVANDSNPVAWIVLGTITLAGSSPQSNGLIMNAAWPYCRANVTAISGTNTKVSASINP